MTRRAELLDVAAQVADHNRAERDEWRAAAMHDRRDLVRIGDRWEDLAYAPDRADVADLEDDRVPDRRDVEDC